MVTLKQIATECGCSVATVSKALNEMPDISSETTARIRDAANKLGYTPNAAARALKTRRTQNIGLFATLQNRSGVACDYISKIVIAFQAAAESSGYDVSLLGSSNKSDPSISYLAHCRYRNFDGVAIICTDFDIPQINEILRSNIPSVTVDAYNELHSMVMTDNEDAMRQAVDYVHSRGHTRIAFIHGDESVVTRLRLAGFHRACLAHGIRVDEAYIRPALFNDAKSTAHAVRELMSLSAPPSCIFFPDDLAYIGGLEALNQLGLNVPNDVSAVGFDGIYMSQAIHPKLCTVRQDAGGIGRAAFKLIKEEIESPKTFLPKQVIVPGVLLQGETVALI